MTDEELRVFLAAVGQRDLHLDRLHGAELQELRHSIENISSIARLAFVSADRSHQSDLYQALGYELVDERGRTPVEFLTGILARRACSIPWMSIFKQSVRP